jgi:DNA replicative helicase MCM subunit Mcm2 (Cdc46/Mcm family)
VAKAGIVCKINTRTTVIAATNPLSNQKWDPSLDLQKNTGIMTSLLSRFDLIFVMIDTHDSQEDALKADYVLSRQCFMSKE